MTPDASKYKVSTTADTFKNSEILESSIYVPAYTFPDGNAQTLTYDFTFDQGETISQIIAKLSYDSSKWHILPLIRFGYYSPSASTNLQLFSSYTGSTLRLTLVILPVGAAPWSYTEFTIYFKAKIFVMPSV